MISFFKKCFPYGLCFTAGSLSALSMAPTNLWPALIIGLSILYIQTAHAKTIKQTFMIGWLFGFGYFLFSLSWIGNALLVDGNPYRWAWPLAICGLPFILAPFIALPCALTRRLFNLHTSHLAHYAGFITLLSLFEFLRGHLFTGFPWNLFGYTWSDILPMIQIVSLGNIYLLSALTIIWCTAPGFLWISPYTRTAKAVITAAIFLSISVNLLYGYVRITNTELKIDPSVQIVIAAPYIPQSQKWDSTKTVENFLTHIEKSNPPTENTPALSPKTTLIIWPETALHPRLLHEHTYTKTLERTLSRHQGNTYLLAGQLRTADNRTGYFNDLSIINKTGETIEHYSKHHLVPFGEYIPFKTFIPLKTINRFSGFIPGDGPQTINIDQNINISPLICYESVFPDIAYSLGTNPPPDLLVNISNDAWYAGTAGPAQHFVQTKFRAIETGISLARAANGGLSGLVDPIGRTTSVPSTNTGPARPLNLPKLEKIYNWNFYFRNGLFFALIATIGLMSALRQIRHINC